MSSVWIRQIITAFWQGVFILKDEVKVECQSEWARGQSWNTVIVGSNHIRGMDVFPHFLSMLSCTWLVGFLFLRRRWNFACRLPTKGCNIRAKYFIALLDSLKQRLASKHGGNLSKIILFLQDNVGPQKAAIHTRNWQIFTLMFSNTRPTRLIWPLWTLHLS
jgi:hypothetical protein